MTNIDKNIINKSKIVLKEIQLKDLIQVSEKQSAFINSKQDAILPITPWRAISQSYNPNAHPNDVVLILAELENEVVGYLGSMPGSIIRKGKVQKVHFLSTFLTASHIRGVGLGKTIINKMFERNEDFVLTGVSDSAERLYKALGLPVIGHYQSVDFKFGEHSLLFRVFRKIGYFVKPAFVKSISFYFARHSSIGSKKNIVKKIINEIVDLNNLLIHPVDQLSNEAKCLRNSNIKTDRFWRNGNTINWMLNHPWIQAKKKENLMIAKSYAFSAIRDKFIYITYELYQKNKIFGFIIFSYSVENCESVLKLLDYEMPTPIAAAMSLREALKRKPSTLTMPANVSANINDKNILKLMKKNERIYYARPKPEGSKLIDKSFDEIQLEAPDGDLFAV